jgi:ADP-ribose pyrophosphatase YjhB (NUDIX family)
MDNHKKEGLIKIHSGVYGICQSDNKLLMILKSRGPYKGQYDLPGGRMESHETLESALGREFEEEIGCSIKDLRFFTCAEDEFQYQNSSGSIITFNHTGSYYIVKLDNNCDIKKNADGHDSLGAAWVGFQDILDGVVSIPNIVRSVLLEFMNKKV